jgi:hypothetical protein
MFWWATQTTFRLRGDRGTRNDSMTVFAEWTPANVAIEQQAVNLHDPVDSLVIGRL